MSLSPTLPTSTIPSSKSSSPSISKSFKAPTTLLPRRRPTSALLTTTLQAILINILANILAQLIEHRKLQAALSSSSSSSSTSSISNEALESLALGKKTLSFEIDGLRVVQFVVWTVMSVPPNFKWQIWLERRFPGYYLDEGRGRGGKVKADEGGLPLVEVGKGIGVGDDGTVRVKKRNFKHTFLKILIDQGCAAPINCSSFLFFMTLLKGGSITDAVFTVRKKFWPLKFAGWRLWPMVAVINFTFVPADRRVIVSTIVGLCWNVFLALFIS